jgi:hypothetical protein
MLNLGSLHRDTMYKSLLDGHKTFEGIYYLHFSVELLENRTQNNILSDSPLSYTYM